MDGFARAYKATKGHRALMHAVPDRDDDRCRALCGYKPRTPWDVVIGRKGFGRAPPCPTCVASYERIRRRTDRGTA